MKKKSILWIFLLLIIIVGIVLYLKKRGIIGEEVVTEKEPPVSPGANWANMLKRFKDLLTRQPPRVGGNGTPQRPPNGPDLYHPQVNGVIYNGVIYTGLKPRPTHELTLEEEKIIDMDLERLSVDSRLYTYVKPLWR